MLATERRGAKNEAGQIWGPRGGEGGCSRCGWLALMAWLYEMPGEGYVTPGEKLGRRDL